MAEQKIALVTHFKQPLEKQARGLGFKIDNKKPDLVIALGGEGTFLFANQKYPKIPRLQILLTPSSKRQFMSICLWILSLLG